MIAKEKGKITHGDYQALSEISKGTAKTELIEGAEKFKALIKTDASGSSISYKTIGQ